MRDINELIGIIKGITFDGVINDKEVVHLQSWVDKNRNMAYEQKQMALIKMVDEVLEDHIIDEDEKEKLIKCAELFLDEKSDNSGKIYELNGIIEGIICDGEVNETEVYKLKEWMDTYGHLIRNFKQTRELCEAIDSVLEDGVVTEEEQDMLLELLSDRIRNTQFETKLEYLCRLVKERKNIGVELIDILNEESAMAEIHKRAERKLMTALNSVTGICHDSEIVVVSLVLIAMLEYDGNYYGSVRSTYSQVYARYSEQRVEGLIRSILSKYKRQKESGTRSRIINVALENAIVPKNYLSAFFEFIFDIYKLNFDYSMPNDPYDEFEFVFKGLRSSMLSDEDDISINVTQKTYKLTVATKQLILREDGLDAVIKLSILIAKLIDKCYWNKDIKIFNPYLKTGFEGWNNQFKERSYGRGAGKKISSKRRSRWEPKFSLENNNVYLWPPVHRVSSQYDYSNISIVVSNDNQELYYDDSFDIREIIGGYQISPRRFEVTRPLGKLKYRLQCGNEIIYDSKERLFRDYIVFKEDGGEVNNNTDFEGAALFCYKPGESKLHNLITKEFYCVGYKLVKQGDAVRIGNDVFNFSSMIKPGVFGELHKNCCIKTNGDKCISVYKIVNFVAFEAENVSNKFEVIINHEQFKLADLKYTTQTRENITKYVVELNLIESGIYSIEIDQLSSGKRISIFKDTFAYDPDLLFETASIDDLHYSIKIVSGLIDGIINKEVSANEFKLEIVEFDYDENMYDYILPLDLGFYSIDNNGWNTAASDLWIEDISLASKMVLFDSECDGLLVYRENGSLAENNAAIIDKGAYKEIPIGFLKSFQTGNKYVMLVFTVGEKKKYVMFCYYCCVFDTEGTEILFSDNPKQIMVTPVFHGKGKVFFEVLNANSEVFFKSKALESGQTEILEEFNSFEEYTFNFHEKTKIMMLRKNTLLHSVKRTFYAREDYVGKVYKIDIAYFDQFRGNEHFEREYHFNKAYLRIIGTLDNNMYEGVVFVKTMRGEWVLENINPVEVEICSEIVDDTMDVYLTNSGDGLLIDFEKRGIMNSLEHPTAPDIFLYTLSMKENEW